VCFFSGLGMLALAVSGISVECAGVGIGGCTGVGIYTSILISEVCVFLWIFFSVCVLECVRDSGLFLAL
jgi:hypothetical protein